MAKKSCSTICLSMIVKNEAHVIRRCLDSVRPIISHWIIVDTGSTDGTQDVVREALADMPGALVERPWVDFATNRNEALKLARRHGDYVLIIDADDELIIPEGFTMPKLREPGYRFEIVDQHTRYWRNQLVSSRKNWRYRGILHEFLSCPDVDETPILPLAMRRGDDGARHRDPNEHARDIAVLKDALSVETDPFMIARYTMYLGTTYDAAGEYRKALDCFLKRIELGGWDEEVYFSLLMAAVNAERLGEPADTLLALYERAIQVILARAEARYGASRCCRQNKRFAEGFRYAEAGLGLKLPSEGISLNPWVYDYGLLDEFAVNAYHIGQYGACGSACLKILGQSNVPRDVFARASTLAREVMAKMVDPVWGLQQAPYGSAFAPEWERLRA
ncbi:glycosyltransferase [Methylobacterium sp. E-005]|uniref:glycosyltransferase n=1 Tax=Methylobacterium sp. E-005 TaxID=2836549 RepID=UPI001FBAE61B|nr:glycosyltransferase [Methylobacterium sp. E-005]MCJ2088324.1 glycosyltransferase [Methylobacterium sp. E-005]